MLELQIEDVDWAAEVKKIAADESAVARLVLEAVGADVVAYLKTYMANANPPHKTTPPPPGPYTPGGWRKITGSLTAGYQPPKVEAISGGWRLTIENTDDTAFIMEARDGFFVVNGILDRNGLVHQRLMDVIPRLAPGWAVVWNR